MPQPEHENRSAGVQQPSGPPNSILSDVTHAKIYGLLNMNRFHRLQYTCPKTGNARHLTFGACIRS